MKNYIQKGDIIDVTAAADVKGGDVLAFGDMVGVAQTDAASGETVALCLKGVFEVAKGTGALTVGQKLYRDATADDGSVTGTATSNKFAGHAVAAAASGDTTVLLRLSI